MKKIISGKKYDTETAHKVYEWSHGSISDFGYYEETLYRKRTGEYFVYGYGHAASKYAEPEGQNSWGSGSRIMPMSYEDARSWMEERADAESYEREFGEVIEDESGCVLTVRISSASKAKLARESAKTGETQGSIIDRLIASLK